MPGVKFTKETKETDEDSGYDSDSTNRIKPPEEIDPENPLISKLENPLPKPV